jgi:hypothetical protein
MEQLLEGTHHTVSSLTSAKTSVGDQKKTSVSVEKTEVIIPLKGSYGGTSSPQLLIYRRFSPVNP